MPQSAAALISILMALVLVVPSALAEEVTRSVKVTGTAVAKVKPDIVVWTISVKSINTNLQAAREANDAVVQSVLAMRNELKIDSKDLQTGNLQIRKVFERDNSGNQGAFRHFSFQRTVVLRQRDTSRFDEVLQQLTGMKDIETSYSLESSDFHKVRRETRLRAVEVAREKASEMTTLLGAKLGHVLTIDETSPGRNSLGSSPLSNSVSFYSGRQVQADEIKGTFAPGSIEIRVSVDIRFAIE